MSTENCFWQRQTPKGRKKVLFILWKQREEGNDWVRDGGIYLFSVSESSVGCTCSSKQTQRFILPDDLTLCSVSVAFSVWFYHDCVYCAFASEPSHIHCGKAAENVNVSCPVQSDEEYLSPQEVEMEAGDSPSLNEPPSFQVRLWMKLKLLTSNQ